MLVIRFSRVGKRNHAQYKIVLAEKSYPVKGKFIELLGSYDPHSKQASLKEDRIKHWMDNGAQTTDSVWNLLVKEGVIKNDKRTITLTPKKVKEGEEEENKTESETKKEKPTEEQKKEEVKKDSTSPKASKDPVSLKLRKAGKKAAKDAEAETKEESKDEERQQPEKEKKKKQSKDSLKEQEEEPKKEAEKK